MPIDKDIIKHISKLARISVDEAKLDNLTKDLNLILIELKLYLILCQWYFCFFD